MTLGVRRLSRAARPGRSLRQGWRTMAALLLIVPLLMAPASQLVAAQGETEPLRIGALFPFTGDLSDFGPAFLSAAELAVNEINAAGGVNGQPIELVQGDTATSPQQAVEEARRLIELEGVPAIIGPAGSGEALPTVESVAGPAGVLVISPSATSPALTVANDSDFFFRTTISDAAQGVVMADLAKEQGFTTACTLFVNNAYGQGLSDAFSARFTAEGGTVAAQVPVEQEQASYASELAACTESNPDVMIAIAYPESARIFLRELIEAGDAPAIIMSDGLKSPDLFEELGWDVFEGSFGTSAGSPETETAAAFETAWQAAYGELPAYPYLREVYDAVYLIALAAEQSDSVAAADIRDALRDVASEPGTVVTPGSEGWTAAMEALAAGDVNYEGAIGPVDLDASGDVAKGTILVWKVSGGEILTDSSRDFTLSGEEEGTPEATPAA
jgi:branched-chain amino acid transport system substrate-binding protein